MRATPALVGFSWLAGLGQDTRYALRRIGRQTGSSSLIVTTLALGIGATVGIHATFDGVLFRPLPGIANPEQVISVSFGTPDAQKWGFGAPAAIPALRAAAKQIEHLGYRLPWPLAVRAAAGDDPIVLSGDFVSRGYFGALGVRARLGRLLSDEEADSGADNLANISERLWRTRFAASPDVLGRHIDVSGYPFVVVGVIDGFRGDLWQGDVDVWLPMGSVRLVLGVPAGLSELVGRVRKGTSVEQLQAQLRATYARTVGTLSPRYAAFVPFVSQSSTSTSDRAGPDTLRLYWLLMAGAGLLLLLGCANAASLLVARAAVRSRDTAIRRALGATRWRVTRESLVEAAALASIAGGLGLVVAVVLTALARGLQVRPGVPTGASLWPDGRILLLCLLTTVVTTLLFGTLPALLASRRQARSLLARAGPSARSPHRRLRQGLVIAQIALSVSLLAGAGVLHQTVQNLTGVDLGMRLDGVSELTLGTRLLRYDDRRAADVRREVLDALRQAGVGAAAVAAPGPLAGVGIYARVQTATMAEAAPMSLAARSVSPDYFAVMGIPLLAGRTFTETEYRDAVRNPMPVVLSASLARTLFGTEHAVGRMFEIELPEPSPAVVVGVVGDTRSTALRRESRPAFYHTGRPVMNAWSILVRTGEPTGLTRAHVREIVRRVDAALPITSLEPLSDQMADALSVDRALARLSALFALFAAVLALTGVAGLVRQVTIERSRDFAIRVALGASRAHIIRDVLGGTATLAVVGLVTGLSVYWWASRWLVARLYGLEALDAGVLATVATLLLGGACLAALGPALRAAHADPALALRQE